mgnify:CR=1 FL=1
MVTQFFLTFFKTFMDFMLLYVETFILGKVTEAILSWLELPGLEAVELGPIVSRTLTCLRHLSCPKRWSSAMILSSTGSTGTFGQLMMGQGLLYLSVLQGLLLTRPQIWVSLFWERLKSYLKTLDYLAVHHLPGSLCVFLSFKIE